LFRLWNFGKALRSTIPLFNFRILCSHMYDQGNQNSRYLEFCCKCVRRAMELGLGSFAELDDILSNKIKVSDQVMAPIETKAAERLEYLEKDIVRKQRRRFNFLEEKVKQIQEASGGAKQFNMK